VEANPEGKLTAEAADSFEVFKDEVGLCLVCTLACRHLPACHPYIAAGAGGPGTSFIMTVLAQRAAWMYAPCGMSHHCLEKHLVHVLTLAGRGGPGAALKCQRWCNRVIACMPQTVRHRLIIQPWSLFFSHNVIFRERRTWGWACTRATSSSHLMGLLWRTPTLTGGIPRYSHGLSGAEDCLCVSTGETPRYSGALVPVVPVWCCTQPENRCLGVLRRCRWDPFGCHRVRPSSNCGNQHQPSA
jgi:hypothetical protein